jgi:transcriptional regulator CtsR
MRLSDTIEQFIKTMMEHEQHEVELKRNELAEYFGCAPSQINYVLSTRFTMDHGYVTESRRGGGGYIRIVRIQTRGSGDLFHSLIQRIGESIRENEATRLIAQLADRQILNPFQAKIMLSAISSQALSVPVPDPVKDAIRARIMRSMLVTVARDVMRLYELGKGEGI